MYILRLAAVLLAGYAETRRFVAEAGPLCNSEAVASFIKNVGLSEEAAQALHDIVMQNAPEIGLCGAKATADTGLRAQLACRAAKSMLANPARGKYLSAETNRTAYDEVVNVNWSDSCHLEASCIVQPASSKSTADLLQIITFFKAPYSTRSGGHNPNPGFGSTAEQGVLLDLGNLKTLEFTKGQASLRVGPGNRFLQVYTKLNGTGKFVVGGRVPAVGVGGFLLGGGMSTWSSLHGTAADNVVRYEVVLANSKIINATSSENGDLFWALKGGASNFGIVTEFELRTFDLPHVYFEATLYNVSYTPQLLDAVIKYQKAAESDSNANLIYNWSPKAILVGFAYAKPHFRPAIFNDFYALPNLTAFINGTIGTPTDMAIAYSDVTPLTPGRRLTFSISHEPSLEVYNAAYNTFLALAPKANSSFQGSLSLGIQPWTSAATRHGLDKNPLGLRPVSQNWMTGVIEWNDTAADQQAYDTISSLAEATKSASAAEGRALDFIFPNDANYGQNVLHGYGEKNLARLRQVSRKFDPKQVFQRQQVDGFLLAKA